MTITIIVVIALLSGQGYLGIFRSIYPRGLAAQVDSCLLGSFFRSICLRSTNLRVSFLRVSFLIGFSQGVAVP